jgi:hypothetical protein
MRIHRSTALLAVLLAGCGGPEQTQSVEQKAADSAAVRAVTQPAGVIDNVNQRLDQADKDAAARTAAGMEQVKEAEGASPP